MRADKVADLVVEQHVVGAAFQPKDVRIFKTLERTHLRCDDVIEYGAVSVQCQCSVSAVSVPVLPTLSLYLQDAMQ